MFSRTRKIALGALYIAGLALTAELIHIYIKANFGINAPASFCSINSLIDCDGVAKTNYALFLGVPLAVWGLTLYSLLIFLTYVQDINKKINFPLLKVFKNPRSYVATIAGFSFLASMLLAFISIFTIQKICILCFVTYFIDLAIAFIAKTPGSFFVVDIKNTFADFIDGVKKYPVLFTVVVAIGIGTLCYINNQGVFVQNAKGTEKGIVEFEKYQKMEKNPYAIKNNVLGNPDGKIVIFDYSDFMCPFCKVVNTMLHKLVKDEKDVIVYHMNYPLDNQCNKYVPSTIHAGACLLSRYAIAAENQDAYWGVANTIYDNRPATEDDILRLAAELGLNTAQLKTDAHSKETDDILLKQIERAHNLEILGTPTVVIDDIIHSGALPYDEMRKFVKQARARHKKSSD